MTAAHEDAPEDPYKQSEPPAALRSIPTIADNPRASRVDVAHTYAIQGWGKDFCGSSLVLMVRMSILPGRSLQVALDYGYALFKEYCNLHHKTTSLTHFSKQVLKVKQLFGTYRGK